MSHVIAYPGITVSAVSALQYFLSYWWWLLWHL